MELIMDIVGACNLRCPSCPVGNTGQTNEAGRTDLNLFKKIVAKADNDYTIFRVSLYNWGEAFLHPQLPQFIEVVKQHNLPCALSTNLNVMRDEKAILAAGPDELRISLSGFGQETYSRTHVRGDIERVKRNMIKLAEAKSQLHWSRTRIDVYFHKYRNNLDDLQPMKELAAKLGFTWMENWAFFMPLEKVVLLAEGALPRSDVEFVDSEIALPIAEALREAQKFKDEPCRLLNEQIVLDYRGYATICCGVYDQAASGIGFFLDMSREEFLARKVGHEVCQRCMLHGVHRYAEYYDHPVLRPLYESLAQNKVSNESPSSA